MAARFLSWAYKVPLTVTAPSRLVQRVVLVALASHANDAGRTWPGLELLRADTGLARSSVSAALTALTAQGRIVPEGRRSGGRTSTRWVLEPAATRAATAPEGSGATVHEMDGCEGQQSGQPSRRRTPTVQEMDPRGPGDGPDTAVETAKNPQKSKPRRSSELERVDTSSPNGDLAGGIDRVFDAWRESTGKTKAQLDPKRRRLIANALKTYPEPDVLDAVRGWANSPFHRGDNDRATTYNRLELILRDAEHIEQFRDLARERPSKPAPKLRSGEKYIFDRVAELKRAEGGADVIDITERSKP